MFINQKELLRILTKINLLFAFDFGGFSVTKLLFLISTSFDNSFEIIEIVLLLLLCWTVLENGFTDLLAGTNRYNVYTYQLLKELLW